MAVYFASTWEVLAIFSSNAGLAIAQGPGQSFLADPMAYAQFAVCLPLFVLAEAYLGPKLTGAIDYFRRLGLVLAEDTERFEQTVNRVSAWATWPAIDIILIVIAYMSTWTWLLGDMRRGVSAWYLTWSAGGAFHFTPITLAGWWAGLFAVPLFNYAVARWAVKAILWCLLLWRTSRLRLSLVPTHPDGTGGLGFLSRIQGSFGILVFAIGCLVVANMASRAQHGVPVAAFTNWGPVFIYAIVAPAAFLAPLLLFTAQLSAARSERLEELSVLAASNSRNWLRRRSRRDDDPELIDPAIVSDLFSRADNMRIVPFDFRSVWQLLASAGAPLVPVAVKLLPLPDWAHMVTELLR